MLGTAGYMVGWGGGLCDFGVTPVPIGLGFGFWTGLGLGLRGPDLGLGLTIILIIISAKKVDVLVPSGCVEILCGLYDNIWSVRAQFCYDHFTS